MRLAMRSGRNTNCPFTSYHVEHTLNVHTVKQKNPQRSKLSYFMDFSIHSDPKNNKIKQRT
jgi:hypothetical protein